MNALGRRSRATTLDGLIFGGLMVVKWVLLAVLLIAVGYGLHRLSIWAENRGWIYYRKGHGRSWGAGYAMQELQSLFHPSARHVVEETRREELSREDKSDSSDWPDADAI
jgi:hypothetical protein